jgi:hypothetical protein
MQFVSRLFVGTWNHSLLRHYATSRKVTGSITMRSLNFFNLPNPSSHTMALGSTQLLTEMYTSISDEVIEFFNLPNPSSHTMVLGSTQPLTEMSTRKLPGWKRTAGA